MANPYLEVDSGAEARRYELEIGLDDVVVGRSTECQWVISSGAVSRRHARIRRQSGQITIEDLGSSNGTFVNDIRLSGPTTLRDRDSVKFGSVEAHFVVPAVEQEPNATVSVEGLAPTMLASSLPGAARPEKPVEPPAAAAPPVAKPAPPAVDDDGEASTLEPEPTGTGTRTTPSMRTRVEPAVSSEPAKPAPAPRPAPAPIPAATAGTGPSFVELVVIAGASFIVVFGLGALLVRFVF